MARAGVSREVAEHCLAHVLPKIEGTYNKYDYLIEKRDAFERLAAFVDRIINRDDDNVVKLPKRR